MKLFNPKLQDIEELKPGLYVQTIPTKKGNEYKLVHPPLKDPKLGWKKDNIHWRNFIAGGRWFNLLAIALVIAIIVFSGYAYKHDTAAAYEIREDPGSFCENWTKLNQELIQQQILDIKLNKEADDGNPIFISS